MSVQRPLFLYTDFLHRNPSVRQNLTEDDWKPLDMAMSGDPHVRYGDGHGKLLNPDGTDFTDVFNQNFAWQMVTDSAPWNPTVDEKWDPGKEALANVLTDITQQSGIKISANTFKGPDLPGNVRTSAMSNVFIEVPNGKQVEINRLKHGTNLLYDDTMEVKVDGKVLQPGEKVTLYEEQYSRRVNGQDVDILKVPYELELSKDGNSLKYITPEYKVSANLAQYPYGEVSYINLDVARNTDNTVNGQKVWLQNGSDPSGILGKFFSRAGTYLQNLWNNGQYNLNQVRREDFTNNAFGEDTRGKFTIQNDQGQNQEIQF